MDVPSIFIAVTTFGAINNTFGLSNEIFPYYNLLVNDGYSFITYSLYLPSITIPVTCTN